MNDSLSPGTQNEALQRLLETQSTGRSKRRWLWLAAVLAVAAGLALFLLRAEEKAAGPRFKTEPVVADRLVVTVSATGNLQPTNQVDVGSELSGIIDQVYVDVNDQVQKGQVLARLDLSKLEDSVAKSRANLASAKAQVLQSQATKAQSRADLARLREVARLSGGKVPSAGEMDAAEADFKRAEADEAKARAAVSQVQADLR